jgi:hypothetical protein
MKTWVRKSLNVGVLSAGFLLVSGGAAHADWTTGYNAGLLDGNQLDTKLQVPVDVSGNALGLLGFADAQSGGGAVANTESATTESANSTESWTTGFNGGILNGNQLSNTVQLPINVCGNSIAVLGFANASCGGGAVANTGGMHAHHGGESAQLEKRHHNGNGGANAAGANGWGGAGANSNGGGNWTTGYNAGVLNGNQASTTIQVPIDLCGNAIAVAGFSSASCSGGAWANTESATTESARTEDHTTGFNAGVGNGNQLQTVLQAPINVCGNSIAVLGFSSASCGGGAVANTGGMGNGNGNGHHHHHNGGNGDGNGDANGGDNYGGTGNGNGAYDNSAGATGVHAHKASKHGKKSGEAADEHGMWNDPNGSGNGDDGYGDVSPAGYSAGANGGYGDSNGNANGNGDDNYGGTGNGNGNGDDNGGRHHRHHGGWGNGNGDANGGGATANAGSCGDWTTGYNAGLLNGNQAKTTLQIPVNISGNAIGILGFANASSQGGAMANAC